MNKAKTTIDIAKECGLSTEIGFGDRLVSQPNENPPKPVANKYVVRRQFRDMVAYAYAHHHGFFTWGLLCQAVKFGTKLEASALIASMALADNSSVSVETIVVPTAQPNEPVAQVEDVALDAEGNFIFNATAIKGYKPNTGDNLFSAPNLEEANKLLETKIAELEAKNKELEKGISKKYYEHDKNREAKIAELEEQAQVDALDIGGLSSMVDKREHQIAKLTAKCEQMREDVELSDGTCDLLSKTLAEICLMLKGEPPYSTEFSYHDLPNLVSELKAKYESLKGIDNE